VTDETAGEGEQSDGLFKSLVIGCTDTGDDMEPSFLSKKLISKHAH